MLLMRCVDCLGSNQTKGDLQMDAPGQVHFVADQVHSPLPAISYLSSAGFPSISDMEGCCLLVDTKS